MLGSLVESVIRAEGFGNLCSIVREVLEFSMGVAITFRNGKGIHGQTRGWPLSAGPAFLDT